MLGSLKSSCAKSIHHQKPFYWLLSKACAGCEVHREPDGRRLSEALPKSASPRFFANMLPKLEKSLPMRAKNCEVLKQY